VEKPLGYILETLKRHSDIDTKTSQSRSKIGLDEFFFGWSSRVCIPEVNECQGRVRQHELERMQTKINDYPIQISLPLCC